MKNEKKRMIYAVLIALIVVFSSTFGILSTIERTDYRNYLQAEYSKNMYDLIGSVQNIRINLGKASIIGSREQGIITFEEIFRNSAVANDKLHSLPVSQSTIADTSKFLTQVGDFCYTLGKVSSEGKKLSESEYASIDKLKRQSFILEQHLKKISADINEGRVSWGEIRKRATGVFSSSREQLLAAKFDGIQKQVVQYPTLIYDGPFSDNVLEIKPKINSQKQVTQKQAEEIVRNIIGNNKIESIQLQPNQGKEKIETFRFLATMKDSSDKKERIICEISKPGGKVLYLLNGRRVNKPNIDMKRAIAIGDNYLRSIGYKNMVSTYSLNYGNIAVINYVYKQQDTIVYPDQIKLKIALDNGSIIGIESEKYLVAHEENRGISIPKITVDQAKKRVGKNLNISNIRLAIVPTEANKELLCYEFLGNYKGDNFIVYINADTGYEEKIVQIVSTPNGNLTM
jgi:germination protein YpeB